jgi:hypothetical protein
MPRPLVNGVPHGLDDVVDRRLPGLEPVVGVNLAQLVERDIGDRKQVSQPDEPRHDPAVTAQPVDVLTIETVQIRLVTGRAYARWQVPPGGRRGLRIRWGAWSIATWAAAA